MRTAKLGNNVLRVVTSTAETRHFSVSGLGHLQLFWIFRNFNILSDRVLSPGQLRRIAELCVKPGAELKDSIVHGSDILGTLEQSAEGAVFFRHIAELHAAGSSAASKARGTAQLQTVSPKRQPVKPAKHDDSPASVHPARKGRRTANGFALAAAVAVVVVAIISLGTVKHSSIEAARRSTILENERSAPRGTSVLEAPLANESRHDSASAEPAVTAAGSEVAASSDATSDVIPTTETPAVESTSGAAHATVTTPAALHLETAARSTEISTQAAKTVAPSPVLVSAKVLAQTATSSAALPDTLVKRVAGEPSHDGVTPPTNPAISSSSNVAGSAIVGNVAPANRSALAAVKPAAPVTLPSAGSPRSPLALPDFPHADRNSEIVLRAVVGANGRVSRVDVLSGNPMLAAAARRTVMNWHYAARGDAPDAESRICFRVIGPDVVTVSFLRPTE